MKCYVSCLCLCYLTILSVWTTLSGTDRRHNPPVTIAKQIHCYFVCLLLIERSNVFAGELWLVFSVFFFFFRRQHDCQLKTNSLRGNITGLHNICHNKWQNITSVNKPTIWLKHFVIYLVCDCYISYLSEDLKMVDGWSGPVGVKGMDAICKHAPLYCALHCHLGWIFVLFRQSSVTKRQRGRPPQTCLHEAVCLHKADSNSLKQKVVPGWMRVWAVTVYTCAEMSGFEDVTSSFHKLKNNL